MFQCYENKKLPSPLIITKMIELDAVSQLILLGMWTFVIKVMLPGH